MKKTITRYERFLIWLIPFTSYYALLRGKIDFMFPNKVLSVDSIMFIGYWAFMLYPLFLVFTWFKELEERKG